MSAVENPYLAEQRIEIDNIDLSIWSLIEKRFAITKEIAKIKRECNIPVLDEKREEMVLVKIDQLPCDEQVKAAMSQIYKLIFQLSRKYQGE